MIDASLFVKHHPLQVEKNSEEICRFPLKSIFLLMVFLLVISSISWNDCTWSHRDMIEGIIQGPWTKHSYYCDECCLQHNTWLMTCAGKPRVPGLSPFIYWITMDLKKNFEELLSKFLPSYWMILLL